MKKIIQVTLQRLLGFDNYLFLFSLFIMNTLRWNKKEGDINYFLELLDEEAIVLDIGANIGIMTVVIAQKCRKGHVHAFEPIPDNCKALNRIVKFKKLENVTLHPIALGEQTQKVQMEMPIMAGVKMQGLSHITHQTIEGYSVPSISYEVEQNSLDELSALKNIRVSAIKMDVENYEQFVLRGGLALIQKDKPLIYCELWDNENRKACFEILKKQGYKPMVLEKNGLVPFSQNIHSQQNFFFLPEKS